MESSINSLSSSSTTTMIPSSNKPAASLANLFLNEINNQDIYGLLDVQRSLLEQMDKSNDKLDQVNKFSAKRYADAQRDFISHTQLLTNMKTDLDLIFKRIKLLKTRISKKYPTAYSNVLRMNSMQNGPLNDDDDDEDDDTAETSSVQASPEKSQTVDSSTVVSSESDENCHPSPLNPE